MPLRFVMDEHLRGPLWNLLIRHNGKGNNPIDVVRVGDEDSVSLGTADPLLLAWAWEQDRILITEDKRSMPGHLREHLAAHGHSPGVMVIRQSVPLREIADFLVLAAYATEPAEWADGVHYIP